MNKEIITKLQNRKRVSDKLGNELDKFVDDIQEMEGVKTIPELTVYINCEFLPQPIRFGICRGEVGFFDEYGKMRYRGGALLMSEYMEREGIDKTLELVREFLFNLEIIGDLSSYDKPLKDLLFEETKDTIK